MNFYILEPNVGLTSIMTLVQVHGILNQSHNQLKIIQRRTNSTQYNIEQHVLHNLPSSLLSVIIVSLYLVVTEVQTMAPSARSRHASPSHHDGRSDSKHCSDGQEIIPQISESRYKVSSNTAVVVYSISFFLSTQQYLDFCRMVFVLCHFQACLFFSVGTSPRLKL